MSAVAVLRVTGHTWPAMQGPDDAIDKRMMRRALRLARRGLGFVEPNPPVGCVIVKNGRVIGEGWHRRFGGPHAEIEALRACRRSPRGATAYVSLEPCSHFGKTPPCVRALIEAGIVRAVIPVADPHPLVNGKGAAALRRAGITVHVGTLAEEAALLLAPFFVRVRLGRPYVIAKWAQDADGSMVVGATGSKWISCPASRRWVHRLRARVNAVVVGAGTVLADDPRLTARDVVVRRSARRVVLDARLRIPESSVLVRTADRLATVVLTSRGAARSAKATRLRRLGVQVVACRTRGGRLILADVLRSPPLDGTTNVLVEGGPALLKSFFAAGLVDEAHAFIAPRRRGWPALRRRRVSAKHRIVSPPPVRVLEGRCGVDRHIEMRFARNSYVS